MWIQESCLSAKIISQLNRLQSDYQVFYQKLRSYHWNVTGPQFFGLHQQFETMYNEIATNIDDIAERTLALGGKPIGTLAEQLKLATIKEDSSTPAAEHMVKNLRADLSKLNESLRDLSSLATEAKDTATVNLADGIADGQEKTAWMLRAFAS